MHRKTFECLGDQTLTESPYLHGKSTPESVLMDKLGAAMKINGLDCS